MKAEIARRLPSGLKRFIGRQNYYETYRARQYAAGLKRTDICAAQVAAMLNQADIRSLEGKVCLEVGAGWVLTHAVVMYLLGAKRVVATDIARHARPGMIRIAMRSAIDSVVRDLLAPYSSHDKVRRRLEHLNSIPRFDFEHLEALGIEYVSPIDLATQTIDVAADFIYSVSVMEHVPRDDIDPLLRALFGTLNAGGAMIHWIHLEDHRDFTRPFEFFTIPEGEYTRAVQTSRGNRVRQSEWLRLFDSIPGANSEVLQAFRRLDKPLPDHLDPSLSTFSEDDLRTSHLMVRTQKTMALDSLHAARPVARHTRPSGTRTRSSPSKATLEESVI